MAEATSKQHAPRPHEPPELPRETTDPPTPSTAPADGTEPKGCGFTAKIPQLPVTDLPLRGPAASPALPASDLPEVSTTLSSPAPARDGHKAPARRRKPSERFGDAEDLLCFPNPCPAQIGAFPHLPVIKGYFIPNNHHPSQTHLARAS